ncbi:MAG: (Fe-S)-binding protein [Phycisphaerae bacterium]|nr:(Fe-S)-binding protein [Phycisphaerae bacterium]MDW8262074.1 (Fe-S)-binding protein [Phycisphaerales bacterium]
MPCYVDQLMPEVGIATVELLEHLGCDVQYDPRQTCCGQPAFNSGYVREARSVAEHMLSVFSGGDEPVIVPSGSCAAMVKVFFDRLFEGRMAHRRARQLARRTFELSDFLVHELKVTDVGASFPHKVTFHDGCHGLRELNSHAAPRQLLQAVRGLQLIEMAEAQTCCGFGGTFSVKFPQISTAMAEVKCRSAVETGAEYVVSNDPSCLMQIGGYVQKQQLPIRTIHLAEVLNHRR